MARTLSLKGYFYKEVSEDGEGLSPSLPLSVLAALFVKIHIHLIGKTPHKLLKTGTRVSYRDNKWLIVMPTSRIKRPEVI